MGDSNDFLINKLMEFITEENIDFLNSKPTVADPLKRFCVCEKADKNSYMYNENSDELFQMFFLNEDLIRTVLVLR